MGFFSGIGSAIGDVLGLAGQGLNLFQGAKNAFGGEADEISDEIERNISFNRGIADQIRSLADYDQIYRDARTEVPRTMRELLRQQARQVARGNVATVVNPERRDETLSSLILRMGPQLRDAARSQSASLLSSAAGATQGIPTQLGMLNQLNRQQSNDVYSLGTALALMGNRTTPQVNVNYGTPGFNPYAQQQPVMWPGT